MRLCPPPDACTHKLSHTHEHTTYTNTCTNTYTRMQQQLHTHTHAYTSTLSHAHAHTHQYKLILPHMHTHTHVHIKGSLRTISRFWGHVFRYGTFLVKHGMKHKMYIYLYIIGYSPNNVIVTPRHHVTFNNRAVATKSSRKCCVEEVSCFRIHSRSEGDLVTAKHPFKVGRTRDKPRSVVFG